jgi:predicted small lipoprotein YifL
MKLHRESFHAHATSVTARFMRATQFPFLSEERWVARIGLSDSVGRAMTVLSDSIRSKAALILVFALAFALAGCGVKNDLVLPDGKPSPKGEKDPSKPPQQQTR